MLQTPHLRRKGFTLTELMISIIIISLIGVGVVSLGESVFKGWKATEDESDIEKSVYGAVNQLTSTLRSARWIGTTYSDADLPATASATATAVTAVNPSDLSPDSGAACFIWTGESNTTKMLLKDVKLIEHDKVNNTLVIWSISETAPNSNTVFAVADLSTPDKIDFFKKLPNMMKRTIATDAMECRFTGWAVNSSTNIRSVEATILFQRGDITRKWHGVISPVAIATSEATLFN